MVRRVSAAALACIASLLVTATAQGRPDFSGTWKQDMANPANGIKGLGNSPNPESLRLGPTPNPLVISQDAGSLTVVEQYLSTQNTVTYALAGQPVLTQIVIARPPFAKAPAEITSRWRDNQLVSTLTVTVSGEARPRRYEQTMSVDANGALIIQQQAIGTEHARTFAYRR